MSATYSNAHLARFRRRWWHFGFCPRCSIRYNEWFWAPGVGEFCWPCAHDLPTTPTGAAHDE